MSVQKSTCRKPRHFHIPICGCGIPVRIPELAKTRHEFICVDPFSAMIPRCGDYPQFFGRTADLVSLYIPTVGQSSKRQEVHKIT
jgi:hypothetical protein